MASTLLLIHRKNLPIWVSGIAIIIVIIFIYGQQVEIENEDRAISFLNTDAGLLVTTLAVTMSFTVLGIQFLAQSYTPRVLVGYLKDWVVYCFPILYLSLITLNLISSAIPAILPPIKFIQFALVGTVFCLVYLIAFIYHIINKVQPESIIFDISRDIDPNGWQSILKHRGLIDTSSQVFKPFMILQQVLVKTISSNDLSQGF
jgi:hypothetical protein